MSEKEEAKVKDTTATEEISESPKVPEELKKTTDEKTAEPKEVIPDRMTERSNFYKSIGEKNKEGSEEAEPSSEASQETKEEEPETPESKEEGKEEPKEELSLEDRIKVKVSKRIGKEVAKRKTAEERVAELEAENETLKASKEEKPDGKKDEVKEPTDEQIDQAYQKALEDGDFKYASEIHRYSLEQQKKKAFAEVDQRNTAQTKVNQETQKKWVALVQDFTVLKEDGKTIDMDHPLNLNNQNSKLYQTAMKFMNDPEIAKEYGYDNSDKILGFRLAVNDARRELIEASERGEFELKPKKTTTKTQPKKRRKAELAIPESESGGDEKAPVQESRQDKAALEIQRRNKIKTERLVGARG